MMPCEEARSLIEAHLSETLDEPTRRALTNHLKTCPSCHRAVEEARLAGMVLRGAAHLDAPPDLASRIKAAARTRLFHRPRPFHERALGSPAFMATCASLLCGAIICLAAIWRVGSVPPETAPAQLVAAPVEVHSLVTVQTMPEARPLRTMPTSSSLRQPLTIRNAGRASRSLVVSDVPISAPRAARPARSRLMPRAADVEQRMPVTPAARDEAADVLSASTPVAAVQRISLPGKVERSLITPIETRRTAGPPEDLLATDGRFSPDDLVGSHTPGVTGAGGDR